MRIKRVEFTGISSVSPMSIDFEAFGNEQIIAIIGENGAGKSSFLDALCGIPFFMEMYSRDPRPIKDNIRPGYRYRMDVEIKGVDTRFIQSDEKGWFCDIEQNGKTVLPNPSITSYKEWVVKNIGSRQMILASMFRLQGGTDISNLDPPIEQMKKRDRMALFREMLGSEDKEVISKAAKREADTLSIEYDKMKADLERLKSEQGKVNAYKEDLSRIEKEITGRGDEMKKAVAELSSDEYQKVAQEINAANITRSSLTTKRHLLFEELSNIKRRIRSREADLSESEGKIRAILNLSGSSDVIDQDGRINLELGRKFVEEYEQEIVAAKREEVDFESDISELQRRYEEWMEYRREVDDLKRKILDAKEEIEILGTVPCEGAGEYSSCRFLTRAVEAKGGLSESYAELFLLEDYAPDEISMEVINERKKEIRRKRELKERFEGNKTRLMSIISQLERHIERRDSLKMTDDSELNRMNEIKSEMDGIDEELKSVGNRLTELYRKNEIASRIGQQISELEKKLIQLDRDRHMLLGMISEIDISTIEEKRKNATGMKAKIDRLRFVEWGAGMKGVQKYDIIEAGPIIEELANKILERVSDRFQVEVRTLVPLKKKDSDGNQMFREEADIMVYDRVRQTLTTIKNLCGGERTQVLEAISSAVSIHWGRKSLFRPETLLRDEPAGNLYPETAPDYVAALRASMEVGELHQVIFVAHQREVWEAADVVIQFTSDGIRRIK